MEKRELTKKEKKQLKIAITKLSVMAFCLTIIFALLIYTAFFFDEETAIRKGIDIDITEQLDQYEEDTYDSWYKESEIKDTVLLTWYNPVSSQCDADPLITADMSKINLEKLKNREIKWIAVSRDLLESYNMGDTVIIESKNPKINGEWVIHDKMNKRFTKRIDLLVASGDKYYNLKMPKEVIIRKKGQDQFLSFFLFVRRKRKGRN